MATTLQKKRNIKYLNRDFESFKRDIVNNYIKVYFPDIYEDFNEASMGVMLVELMSFIGDNLSFYLDRVFNESFISSAREEKNVAKHAKHLGFKYFGKSAAAGQVDCFLKVPAIITNQQILPNMQYAGTFKKGTSKFKNSSGLTYETLVDIDFSKVNINDPNVVTVVDRNPTTKQPTSFALKLKNIDVKAGETKTTTFTVGAYKPFLKLTIPDNDVLEVVSIKDSENNIWYEVDFLAQDTVFDSVPNLNSDSADVPYVLKLRSVPQRFITEYDPVTKKTSCIFGTGDALNFDNDLIPNLGDLSIPLFGKDTFTDYSIDPQNFLKTRTLGLAPINTTLTVTYRVGGGQETNAGAGEVKGVAAKGTFEVGDSSLSSQVVESVGNTLSVTNPTPILGGRDEFSLDEIKQLISAYFAAQARTVTREDFIVRTLTIPPKFGSVFRAHAKNSHTNKGAVELVVLSRDNNGNVCSAPNSMKENIKTYLSRFRMLTDAVEILNGKIFNIGISFSVLVRPDFNKTEVLTNCISLLKSYFNIEKWQINQPINLTEVECLIADVPGVYSVYDLTISSKAGSFDGKSYSTDTYNIKKNIQNNILYCQPNAIFEVKYPNADIRGTAK